MHLEKEELIRYLKGNEENVMFSQKAMTSAIIKDLENDNYVKYTIEENINQKHIAVRFYTEELKRHFGEEHHLCLYVSTCMAWIDYRGNKAVDYIKNELMDLFADEINKEDSEIYFDLLTYVEIIDNHKPIDDVFVLCKYNTETNRIIGLWIGIKVRHIDLRFGESLI